MRKHVETLTKLSSIKSRIEKLEFLKQALEDKEFEKIVYYTLNPFITFGITDYDIEPSDRPDVKDDLFKFLDRLAKREFTGSAARLMVGQYVLNDDAAANILLLILNKDLKCGIGAKTVNEAKPGLIPDFPICLAEEYRAMQTDFPFFQAPKIDGIRCLAICESPTQVSLRSREGFELGPLSDIRQSITNHYERFGEPFVLDGEMYVESLIETNSQVKRKKEPTKQVIFYVFDYIPLSIFLARMTHLTLEERYALLHDVLSDEQGLVKLIPHQLVNSDQEVQILHQSYLETGYEGSILRKPTSLYDFRRSWSWQKLKNHKTIDLPVIGMIEGDKDKGLSGTLGALIVDYKGVPVNVFGFTMEQRREFWACMPAIIEVEYQDETLNGSLRHARFLKVRTDKS